MRNKNPVEQQIAVIMKKSVKSSSLLRVGKNPKKDRFPFSNSQTMIQERVS